MGMRIAAALAFTVMATAAVIAYASRNSSGTMAAANGPYVAGTVISSTIVNARFSDIETEITDSLSRSGKGGMTAPLRTADGSAAAPAHSFTSETGTGLYRVGTNDLGLAIGGVKTHEWLAAGETVTGTLGVSGVSTLTGNVGIGSAPTYPLDVIAVSGTQARFGGSVSSMAIVSRTGIDPRIEGNSAWTGANDAYVMTGPAGILQVPGPSVGDFIFYTAPSGTAGTTPSFTERARVNTSGVTIGSGGTAISASFRGTTSWTPGSLAQHACATTSITVTGAIAGTECMVGTPGEPLEVVTTCNVTANTCNLTMCNEETGAATGASGTYSCRVFNP